MRKVTIAGLVVLVATAVAIAGGQPFFEPSLGQLRAEASASSRTELATQPTRLSRREAAAEWHAMRERDEHAAIPSGAYARAIGERQALVTATKQRSAAGAGITRSSWTTIGPGNVGGSVRGLVFPSSGDSQTMLMASIGGGVWRTGDGGVSWQPTDDLMGSLSVSAIAANPANPSVVYAGTGGSLGGSFNQSSGGLGIFKSSDGGKSWAQLASTNDADGLFYRGVFRIAISSDGATILASTKPYSNTAGLWRSTDAGATWTEVSQTPGARWPDLAFHPTDPRQAMAGSSDGRLRYSTDGGATWRDSTGVPGGKRIAMAYAPSNGNVVYASADQNNGEIYRSDDGGRTFTLTNTGGQFLGNQGWYCNVLWVDPTNANVLIVGGTDLFRSTDGGRTFAKISSWQEASRAAQSGDKSPTPHADHHAIVSAPGFNGTTNKTVYFLNDGGIYQTRDVYLVGEVTGWESLNNDLGVTQFYSVAVNPTTGVVVGGTQDNGSIRYGGDSQKWVAFNGGDGGYSAADPTDSTVFYGEYVYLTVARSNDAGLKARDIYGSFYRSTATGWEKATTASPISEAQANGANFIAPFVLDPNNPDRMLAGGRSLWRTSNVKTPMDPEAGTGPAWSPIKDVAATNISAIAVAMGNSDVIWVGHNDGAIFKTANGTAATPTWTQVATGQGPTPGRFVTRITIVDANTAYATFGGYTADNVWGTTDGGQSWRSVSGSGASALPKAPVNTLVVNPDNPQFLYVGTEVGIFTSEDRGATWGTTQDGPAAVATYDLVWVGKTLYAATFGRGIWRTTNAVPGTRPAAAPSGACFTVSLTAQPTAAGSATLTPATNCTTTAGAAGYLDGTIVDFAATPAGGYTFGTWTGLKDVGRQTIARIKVTSNLVVSAGFALAATNDDTRTARAIPTAGERSAAAAGGYVDVVNTKNATTGSDDHVSCNGDLGRASVWYSYTATRNGTLVFDTTGSSYNTVVTVYEGQPGKLTEDICAEDNFENDGQYADDEPNGKVSFQVEAGKTYYIEVADGSEAPEDPDDTLHGGRDLEFPGGGVLMVKATAGAPRYRVVLPAIGDRSTLKGG